MYISKLTILSKPPIPKISILNPSKEIAQSVLMNSVAENYHRFSTEKLPHRIINKIFKEHSIPPYINRDCYKMKNIALEDSKTFGDNSINFFS